MKELFRDWLVAHGTRAIPPARAEAGDDHRLVQPQHRRFKRSSSVPTNTPRRAVNDIRYPSHSLATVFPRLPTHLEGLGEYLVHAEDRWVVSLHRRRGRFSGRALSCLLRHRITSLWAGRAQPRSSSPLRRP